MRVVLSVICSLIAACGSTPYAEVGLTYQLPFSADYWVHSDRSWQCEQPGFDAELGLEFDNGLKLGAHHESMVLCGTLNTKPEIFQNSIRLSKKWGGQ